MAYTLTERAKSLLNRTNIEPNIVLCIDGLETCFGAQITSVYVKIGMPGLKIGSGWKIGGVISDDHILDYISLDGTTTNITQQLDLDKGGATSTQTIKVRLIDFNQEVTRLISPGFDLNDVLYRDAQLYLGFKDGAFPDDYVDMFIGKIQTIEAGAGFVELTIAHPEELKRSEIFPRIETVLVTDAGYYSKVIQDLTYQQLGKFDGVVEVRYLHSAFFGNNASVSVSGNLITVTIETGVTAANTILSAVKNHITASTMVNVLVSGNGLATQSAVGITPLEVSDEIEVEDVTGFLDAVDPIFRTYVRINDEVIEYTGIDTVNNKFTGCVRRSLDSLGGFHETEDEVSSYYKLGDDTEDSNAIDLALQLKLSGGDEFYLSEIGNLQFYNFGTGDNYPNGFLITGIDAVRRYNIQAGDFCTVTGATNGANNFVLGTIEDVEVIDLGTIIYIEGASFIPESGTAAEASFKSQYNTLPDGCGFLPNQVDIVRFKQIQERFPSSIANYEIFLKDTVNAKDFINTEIFLPSALYSIPRQGKASIGISAPPLYEGGSKTLDISTVKNPNKLKTNRSVNKYFYNAIVYKYNEDSIEDRQLSGRIIYSADSQNRVNAPIKPYTITARGIRPSNANDLLIERNCKRFLQRFQFAAEVIPVEPDYKTGYTVEVGDSIIFGGDELQVSDSLSGSRNYKPRVFEVVNKEFDWKTGAIRLNIVDTNFSSGVRYGVWSPASIIGTGSTTSSVIITDSFGAESENDKWTPYIGKTIRVRSTDYTFSEDVKFVRFSDSNDHAIIVDPPLSSPPTSGMILDVPMYDDLNENADSIYKAAHVFWTPTLTVVSGISSTQFTVSAGDASLLFVNSLIRIHNDDYTIDSSDTVIKVTDITGTTITCGDIGFTPSVGQNINLVGFVSDQGNPYTWV